MLLNRIEYALINNPARAAVAEVARVLKPGGRFYAEEVFERFIVHPIIRRLLEHPLTDRFDAARFARELEASVFDIGDVEELWGGFGWFTARKRAASGG